MSPSTRVLQTVLFGLFTTLSVCGCGAGGDDCKSICGNSEIECDERCDDGNALNQEGCSDTCEIEACPDLDNDG